MPAGLLVAIVHSHTTYLYRRGFCGWLHERRKHCLYAFTSDTTLFLFLLGFCLYTTPLSYSALPRIFYVTAWTAWRSPCRAVSYSLPVRYLLVRFCLPGRVKEDEHAQRLRHSFGTLTDRVTVLWILLRCCLRTTPFCHPLLCTLLFVRFGGRDVIHIPRSGVGWFNCMPYLLRTLSAP